MRVSRIHGGWIVGTGGYFRHMRTLYRLYRVCGWGRLSAGWRAVAGF